MTITIRTPKVSVPKAEEVTAAAGFALGKAKAKVRARKGMFTAKVRRVKAAFASGYKAGQQG